MKAIQTILVMIILVGCSTSKNVRQFSEQARQTGYFNVDSSGKRIVQSSAVTRDTATSVSKVDSAFDTESIEHIREWFLTGGDLRKIINGGDTFHSLTKITVSPDQPLMLRETTRSIRTRGSKTTTATTTQSSNDSTGKIVVDTSAKTSTAAVESTTNKSSYEKNVRKWFMANWGWCMLIGCTLLLVFFIRFRKKLFPQHFK